MTDHDDTQSESNNVRMMREKIEQLQAEIENERASKKQLNDALTAAAFKEAGFDLDSGQGKALVRTYQGDPDPEAIRQFAQSEYGWGPEAPGQASREQSQQRLDRLDQAGRPEGDVNPISEADEALKSGDWAKSLALKTQALRSLTPERS